jgi:SSS family solute:Na+ symporter
MNMMLLGSIVLIFLMINAYLGYLGFRRMKNASDYLLAGRKAHPVIMAISYGATFISTSAIVGFGGAAAVYGMGILWLTVLNIFVGIFIAFVLFGKRTRKMGHNLDAHTFPEFIGKRYQSRFLHTAAALLIFVAMPLYAGSVIIVGTQFITQTLNINYEVALLFFVGIVAVYVIMGGMKGVMYTDAFQGAVMFIGMFLLLVFTYQKLGGVVHAHQSLTALKGEAIKVFGPMGHQGWTSMPKFGSVFWFQLVTTIVMGVGIGVLAQPQLVLRFMTVKSNREINRAVLIGGVFILMMKGVAFVVGALTNVYFHNEMGKIAFLAVEKKTDNIIPLFINMFVTGLVASSFWLVFVHTKESKPLGLCKAVFGTDSLATVAWIQNLDSNVIALPLSIIAALVVSFMTRAPEEKHLAMAFDGI